MARGRLVALTVLLDENLIVLIMGDLARLHRGSGWQVYALLCKVWRSCLQVVEDRIAGWCERTWVVTELRQNSYLYLPLDVGAYDWEIGLNLKLPVIVKDRDTSDARIAVLPPTDSAMLEQWGQEAGVLDLVAVKLRVPNAANLPERWCRRTEWILTLHHPLLDRLNRTKYFRMHFSSEQSEFPSLEDRRVDEEIAPRDTVFLSVRDADGALISFGALSAVIAEGFFKGEQLTLSLRVRVHPGNQFCTLVPQVDDLRDIREIPDG